MRSVVAGEYAEIGGYRTRFLRKGSGPPVLLLHGQAPGSCIDVVWGATIDPLVEAGFTVYAFDQVGFGHTEHPTDYTIAPRIAHTRAFIQEMGLAQFAIWSASDGAYIACTMALEGHGIARLVLMANGTLPPRSPSDSDEALGERAAARAGYTPSLEHARDRLLESIPNPAAVTDELVQLMLEMTSGKHFEAIQARTQAKRPPPIYDELKRLTIPVLLLWGVQGGAGPDRGLLLLQKIPGAELHVFDSCGQWPQRDHAQRTNALVCDFLRSSMR